MADYIHRLIREGEHQRLDFKFEVSDYYKIARSLAAFANSEGGRLLVGVRDNGSIAGVRSEEEVFMVEGAAGLYCRPAIPFRYEEWVVEGRRVVEFIIAPSPAKPHYALDQDGRWLVWVRRHDQILLANAILLRVWEKRQGRKQVTIRYTEAERILLQHLEKHRRISLPGFQRKAGISRVRAGRILVDFILLGMVRQVITEKGTYYILGTESGDGNGL